MKLRFRVLVAVALLAPMASLVAADACSAFRSDRADSAAIRRAAAPIALRVTILGDPADARIPPVREAIAHWNSEFLRLGRHVQLDSGTVRDDSVPDAMLRAASGAAIWGGRPINALRERVSDVQGDIIVALSHTDLISFSARWSDGQKGIVGLRRADVWPLSLPNTVRNVAAHELGHVLGLDHNTDATTLMCGRPASCRPAAFASDSAHFFPLTPRDERWIQSRWP